MPNPRPILTIRHNGFNVLDRRAPNAAKAITLANQWLTDNQIDGPEAARALEETWYRGHGTLNHPTAGHITIRLT